MAGLDEMHKFFFLKFLMLMVALCPLVSSANPPIDIKNIHLRGFNVDLNLKSQDFRNLDDLNVNAVRVSFASTPLFDGDGGLNVEAMKMMYKYIRYAKKYNILLLVDVHTFPGNIKKYSGSLEDEYWKSNDQKEKLIESYTKLAESLKGESAVLGYDIVNEAAPPNFGEYINFIKEVSKVMLKISPDKLLLIQPPITLQSNGIANGQRNNWDEISSLVNDETILGSLHYYDPGTFTHQGLHSFPSDQRLPILLRSENSLKLYFTQTLSKVLKHPAPIIVGEFSVSNYGPAEDSALYIKTLLSLFESNNWSWFYHSYREADIWNPEVMLTKNGFVPDKESKKYLLLKEHFKLNERFKID